MQQDALNQMDPEKEAQLDAASRNTLSALCIRRPVLTLVMSVFLLVLGAVSFGFLGVREFPAVNPPTITVTTTYAGAVADVIETQITEPLEASINGVDGIRNLSSTSQEGRSQITVEFDIATDLDAAANDVRDRVSRVLRSLPADADPPTVAKADANSFPILVMTVQGDKRPLLEVNEVGTHLKEKLETIPGVAEVRIWGERRYAMRLLLDPFKLSARGLTLDDVRQALRQDNLQLPSGRLEGPQIELSVVAPAKLSTPEEFGNIIISSKPEGAVRVSDIGRVVLGSENERTLLRMNGIPMVGLALITQPNANALEIAHHFYQRFEKLKKEVPEDIRLKIAFDNTRFIERSVLEVRETIAIAFVLVLLVLFLFLRSWRTAIIPALAIPISLVGGFFIMYLAGFTINVLTLLALVLAIGLVVDDAIVVLEAIYARVEKGEPAMQAGFRGSREIFFAVLATTLVLVVIFLPIMFLGGFTGRLFREFGIVLAGSVLISAFVSLTLTPMLSARLLRRPGVNSIYHRTEPFFEGLINGYRKSLQAFLNIRIVAWVVLVATMVGTYALMTTIKSELAPLEDRSIINVTASTAEGTSYAAMDATVVRLVDMVSNIVPEANVLSVTSPGFVGGGGSNGAFMRLILVDPEERQRSQQQIADLLGGALRGMTDMRAFASQDQTIQVGTRAGLPIQLVIQAPDFESLRSVLPKFLEEARKDPTFVVVDENLKFNRPQLRVNVDRDRARSLGASVGVVAQSLQAAYGETRIDYFIKDSRQFNVVAQLDAPFRDEPSDLLAVPVRTQSGNLVPLANLVRLNEQSGPPQRYRFNRYVSATVSAGLAPGKTMGEGIAAMQRIGGQVLGPSFTTALNGPSRDFAESKSSLLFAFLMALIMVYLTLAAQFESFRHPFTVMLTVPLALFGALASLRLTGQTLNIFSEIGLIMLIGLVTKNGILIVEFANQRREQGLPLREAILSASASRFRPIVMTSLTTALGTLPIALGLGAGSQSRIPMGVAVVGGLLFSLVLTLYIIPALYTYLAGKAPNAGHGPETSPVGNGPGTKPGWQGKLATLVGLMVLLGGVRLGIAEEGPFRWPTKLEEAIQTAQERNPLVLAEREALARAEASVTWNQAGAWPRIDATAGVNQNLQDTRVRRLGSTADSVKNGAVSTAYTAGINGSWTVFEGLKTPALRSQLGLQRDLAALRLDEVKLEVALQAAGAYYGVLRDRELSLAADTLVMLTEERLRLVRAMRAAGGISRQEELAAEADLLAQQAARIRARQALSNSWRGLAQWLQAPQTAEAESSLVTLAAALSDPGDPPSRDAQKLNQQISEQSIEVRRSRLGERLAQAGWKNSLSELWPKLSLTAGYNYSLNKAEAGLVAYNQALGTSVGAQVRLNLISFGSLPEAARQARALARETVWRSAWALEKAKVDLDRAASQMGGCREALGLERRNRALAAESARLMMERLRAGGVSQVEVHLNEERYLSAVKQSVGQLFDCRDRDLQILRAAGAFSAFP